MTDEQIEELLNLRADTAFNMCYCDALAKRYQGWHNLGMCFVALFTSTTVLSWLASIEWSTTSKTLSVIAAGLALVLPILKFDDKSKRMRATYAEWYMIKCEYDALWAKRKIVNQQEAAERIAEILIREGKESVRDVGLSFDNEKVQQKCADRVNSKFFPA